MTARHLLRFVLLAAPSAAAAGCVALLGDFSLGDGASASLSPDGTPGEGGAAADATGEEAAFDGSFGDRAVDGASGTDGGSDGTASAEGGTGGTRDGAVESGGPDAPVSGGDGGSSDAGCLSPGTVCNGSCVDVNGSNASHCGACGHDCQGGACSGGVCQPFALATISGLSGGLFIDANGLYSVVNTGSGPSGGGGEATAFNIATGAVIGQAADNQAASLVAQDSTYVYAVTGAFVFGYKKAALPAGGVNFDPSNYLSLGYVASTGSAVFWSADQINVNTNFILDSTPAGTFQGTYIDTPPVIGPLAGDAFGLVWQPQTGGLFAYYPSLAVTRSTLKTPAGLQAGAMIVDQFNVYYFDKTAQVLSSSARDGSSLTNLVTSALPRVPPQLAVDSTPGPQQFVYWVDRTAGTLSKASTAGGAATPTVLVAGQSGMMGGVASDTTAVYYTTSTALMKIAK